MIRAEGYRLFEAGRFQAEPVYQGSCASTRWTHWPTSI